MSDIQCNFVLERCHVIFYEVNLPTISSLDNSCAFWISSLSSNLIHLTFFCFFFFFKSRFCLDSVTRLSKFTFESNFDRIWVGPYVDWRLENMYIWPILYGALVLFMVGEFKKVLRVFGVTFTFSLITWCGTLTSWQIANIYLFIYLNK